MIGLQGSAVEKVRKGKDMKVHRSKDGVIKGCAWGSRIAKVHSLSEKGTDQYRKDMDPYRYTVMRCDACKGLVTAEVYADGGIDFGDCPECGHVGQSTAIDYAAEWDRKRDLMEAVHERASKWARVSDLPGEDYDVDSFSGVIVCDKCKHNYFFDWFDIKDTFDACLECGYDGSVEPSSFGVNDFMYQIPWGSMVDKPRGMLNSRGTDIIYCAHVECDKCGTISVVTSGTCILRSDHCPQCKYKGHEPESEPDDWCSERTLRWASPSAPPRKISESMTGYVSVIVCKGCGWTHMVISEAQRCDRECCDQCGHGKVVAEEPEVKPETKGRPSDLHQFFLSLIMETLKPELSDMRECLEHADSDAATRRLKHIAEVKLQAIELAGKMVKADMEWSTKVNK